MSSFLGRLRGNANTPNPSSTAAPAKKDINAPILSPLEKLMSNPGPLRQDGSDKFFGFENFGSTCYANSIIQSLYYSAPFREQVITFPSRLSVDPLQQSSSGAPSNSHGLLPIRSKNGLQKPKPLVASPATQLIKAEENKDSPEYKKKQALLAGPLISMDYENANSYGMAESLFTALKDIFEAVIAHKSRTGVVSPHKFLEILRRENEMFRTPMHQDAHEFLNLLLNDVVETVERFTKSQDDAVKKLHDGENGNQVDTTSSVTNHHRNPAQTSRWVHELFEGTLTSETRCLTCENISQRDEPFLDLSVDLEQHTSVTACLRKFSAEEMLCERNKFHCDNCSGLQEAEKRMKIKRLPRILALHLKRFKYTEDYNRLQKLFHRVVYPYYLRLFNTTDDAEDPDRLYELYAVVVHIGGGPYHGHYVSIVKTKEKGWLLFDDEMVEPVDKSYVRNFFGGEGNLACAYVLFYQETTLEAMQQELEAEGAVASDIISKAAEMQREPEAILHHTKMNGTANGSAYPRPDTTRMPIAEEPARPSFSNLGRAYTEPAARSDVPAPAEVYPTITNQAPLPALPGDMTRTKTQSHLQTRMEQLRDSREARIDALQGRHEEKRDARGARKDARKEEKEAKREEKAREKEMKAQEKDLEKVRKKEAEEAEKRRRREQEERRKDGYKHQEDDLRAAMAASRAAKAEEDERRATGSAMSSSTEPSIAGASEHESLPSNGGPVGGGVLGLARFRTQSLGIKSKGPKEKKEKHKERYMFGLDNPALERQSAPSNGTSHTNPFRQGFAQEEANGHGAAVHSSVKHNPDSERNSSPQTRQSVPAMHASLSQQLQDAADSSTWTALPTAPKRSMTETFGQPKEKEKEKGFRFGLGRKKSMMYGS